MYHKLIFVVVIVGLGLGLGLLNSVHAYSEEINKAIERGKKIGSEAADIVNGEIKNMTICEGGSLGIGGKTK